MTSYAAPSCLSTCLLMPSSSNIFYTVTQCKVYKISTHLPWYSMCNPQEFELPVSNRFAEKNRTFSYIFMISYGPSSLSRCLLMSSCSNISYTRTLSTISKLPINLGSYMLNIPVEFEVQVLNRLLEKKDGTSLICS